MEEDVRTFLERFSPGELTRWGILRGSRCLLQGLSVTPLIGLMKEHNVTRLVAEDRRWFLTSDGEFSNPRSGQGDIRRGRIGDLRKPGSVFTEQNLYINPHYESYRPLDIPPSGLPPDRRLVHRTPSPSPDTLTPKPLTADDLAKMRRGLNRLMDSIDDARLDEGVRGRVLRLRKDRNNEGKIPRLIADAMLMVIQARNDLEYDVKKLSSKQEDAVKAVWEVVREWALAEGLEADLAV